MIAPIQMLLMVLGIIGKRCPKHWFWYGDKCAGYFSTPKNHADAQAECKKLGGNLVSVHSDKDYKQLQDRIKHLTNKDGEAWLGGVDLAKNNKWTWLDGSKFDFSSWCVGQPDNPVQNCIQMNFSAKNCWDDLECDHRLPYFCVKPWRS